MDEPVLWWEGAGTADGRSLLADRQGSIVATAPLAGGTSAVSLYTYGPYGERTSWGGSRFAYTGQIALPEASLYHYKARAYDPTRGWFLQTDPIGYEAGDFNLYAYVGGDPVNKADPSGLCDGNTLQITPCEPPEDKPKPKPGDCENRSDCSIIPGDGWSGYSNLPTNRSLEQQKADFAKSQAETTPEVNRQLLEGAGTLIGAAIPLGRVVSAALVGAGKAAEGIAVARGAGAAATQAEGRFVVSGGPRPPKGPYTAHTSEPANVPSWGAPRPPRPGGSPNPVGSGAPPVLGSALKNIEDVVRIIFGANH